MSKERIHRRRLWMQMSGGLRVEVKLIGGQRLDFSVGIKLTTQDLVKLVASNYALKDTHYFSFAFINSLGNYQWLNEERRLLDHEFARGVKSLPLSFLAKYYPKCGVEVKDPQAVEILYHHAKDCMLKDNLLADKIIVCKLSANSLYVSHGDFLDKSTIRFLLKNSILPLRLKEDKATFDHCHNHVYQQYCQLNGLSRGSAILKYMREVEAIPGYGVHYYTVYDRSHCRQLIGICRAGITEHEQEDRYRPKNQFLWQQLENLYIHDNKFSIEVRPQNSLISRRHFYSGNVNLVSWYSETQQHCSEVWSMAISQHKFYLERKTIKVRENMKDSFDLAGELSKSYLSLSAQSSPSISRSESHSSIHQNMIGDDTASTESLKAARLELVSALQQRHDALKQRLDEKTKELKLICLKEGELVGELPPEYPLDNGELPPVVRKRIGTSFIIEEALIGKLLNKQDETISALELEYEIQTKIATAALKLANEVALRKGVRRQRKHSYQQALSKLKEIERKLKVAKSKQLQTCNSSSTMPKMKKKPRPFSDSDGSPEEQYVGRGSIGSRNCEYMETSLLNTSHASVGSARPPHKLPSHTSHVEESQLKKVFQSAPPSPLVGSSIANSDSSSSANAASDGSRASSPGRPVSGYIPSGVYTRSQYRAHHYPTFSTRGQSVPLEVSHQDQSFSRAYFNIPEQRGSIVSHSMDDLDASRNKSPYSPTNLAATAHQYQFHHHHYDHHSRRPVTEPEDRYGSLDRRRLSSARYESRSMEQLNDGSAGHPQLTPNYPLSPSSHIAYPYRSGPVEGETFPEHGCSNGFNKTDHDVIDGMFGPTPRRSHSLAQSRQLYAQNTTPGRCDGSSDGNTSLSNVHRMVRTSSERSYMETSFNCDPTLSSNQENIPPGTQVLHRSSSKTELKPYRATAILNTPDYSRPYRVPVNELPPLRATQSTVDLPPLKATHTQHDLVSRATNVSLSQFSRESSQCTPRSYGEEPLLSLAEAARSKKDRNNWTSESIDKSDQSKYMQRTMRSDSVPPISFKMSPQSIHNVSTSSSGSNGSVFPAVSDSCDPLNSSLNATLTVDSPSSHMLINAGTFQPSREISKPFEMSDFYKYSTRYRRQSASHLSSDHSSESASPLPNVSSKLPPSPSIVARHSSPAPQQKGIYHPPALMTCQPIGKMSNGILEYTGDLSEQNHSSVGSSTWQAGQVHQAVPATVTNKRAATLV